jgi:hypothetical protein
MNFKFIKNNWKKILSVIIAIITFIVLYNYLYNNTDNTNNTNSKSENIIIENNIESFSTLNNKQNGNLLYSFTGQLSTIDNSSDISLSTSDNGLTDSELVKYNIFTIDLNDTRKITDIVYNFGDNYTDVKIGVLNKNTNDLNYLNVNPSGKDIIEKVIKVSNGDQYNYNVKDIYNNSIIGDQIIFYISTNKDSSLVSGYTNIDAKYYYNDLKNGSASIYTYTNEIKTIFTNYAHIGSNPPPAFTDYYNNISNSNNQILTAKNNIANVSEPYNSSKQQDLINNYNTIKLKIEDIKVVINNAKIHEFSIDNDLDYTDIDINLENAENTINNITTLLDNYKKTVDLSSSANINIEICGIYQDEVINENELEYLYDKASDITGTGADKLEKLSFDSTGDITSSNVYKITTLEFSTISSKPNQPFNILYRNPYTEEVMTYRSSRADGKFEVTTNFNKIIIYDKVLLASEIQILQYDTDGSELTTQALSNVIIKGYNANLNDINQFKLENNLTDLRGSINPVDVCPSIDQVIQGQLNAETIIDAMEYQEKIKDEKIKLQSRKEALLTLIEQKEDISRLGNMLNKIDTLTEKRNKDTDALNAIKFHKQLQEVNKLKEVLDARIEHNKRNTYNIDNIALNIYRDPTTEEINNNYLSILTSDKNLNEQIGTQNSMPNIIDEFVDMRPKLPIEEEMRV